MFEVCLFDYLPVRLSVTLQRNAFFFCKKVDNFGMFQVIKI